MQGEQLLQDPKFRSALDRSPFKEKDLPGLSTAIADTFDRMSPEQRVELRKASEDLKKLSLEELTGIDQAFAYIQKNSDKYAEVIQQIVATGALDKEDFPPKYNPELVAVVRAMLARAIISVRSQRKAAPGFAQGGIVSLQKAAQQVQSAGRSGDSVLAHINPMEADMLRRMGGRGSINPSTGLPEFGWFSKAWKNVIRPVLKIGAQIVATAVLAPFVGPIAAGAIVGGVTSLLSGGNARENLTAALFGGVTAGVTAGVSSSLSGGSFFDGATAGGSFFSGGAPQGNAVTNFLGITTAPDAAAAASTAGGNALQPTTDGVRPPNALDGIPEGNPASVGKLGPEVPAGSAPAATGVKGFMSDAKAFGETYKWPLLIGGGAALIAADKLTKEDIKPSLVSQKTGFDLVEEDPAKYKIDLSKYNNPRDRTAPSVIPGGKYIRTPLPYYPEYNMPEPDLPYVRQSSGGITEARAGGHINGPGHGTSDSIPARLSDGEFVMTAKSVRGAGDGSRAAGARKMYDLMNKFERMA